MFPVPTGLPPEATVYQLIVPTFVNAPKLTVPELQTLDGVVDVILGVLIYCCIY